MYITPTRVIYNSQVRNHLVKDQPSPIETHEKSLLKRGSWNKPKVIKQTDSRIVEEKNDRDKRGSIVGRAFIPRKDRHSPDRASRILIESLPLFPASSLRLDPPSPPRARVSLPLCKRVYIRIHTRPGRKRKKDRSSRPWLCVPRGELAAACRIDVPWARSLVSPGWEIRRYKTDLADWWQPVQRPDVAAALVARVRERRSRHGVRYSREETRGNQ